MSLKHGLLGLLNYGDMTGYELDKGFKESLGFFWQAQTSQIYRELNAMEKCGWLKSQIVFQTEKPNKRSYAITAKGKAELKEWLTKEPLSAKFSNRNTFLMKVFFAGENQTNQNMDLLIAYKNDCLQALKNLERADTVIDFYQGQVTKSEDSFYWSAAADFGKMYIQTSLNWVNKTIERLKRKEGSRNENI